MSRMSANGELRRLLDRARDRLEHDTAAALGDLAAGMTAVRAALSSAAWSAAIHDHVAGHPLLQELAASPLARRLRERPRGAGSDAILLDLMLDIPGAADCDLLGSAIYRFELALPSIAIWRFASALIRRRLFRLRSVQPDCHVLALAGGHLRELDSTLLRTFGPDARFVALDDDAAATAAVRRRLTDPRVVPVTINPATLPENIAPVGSGFDLAYRIAPDCGAEGDERTSLVLSLLSPGGTFQWVALARHRPDAAYLEACLGWRPRDHGRAELGRLLRAARKHAAAVKFARHGMSYIVTLVRGVAQ